MSKKKQKDPGRGIAQLLQTLSKKDTASETTRGQKRNRDGTPVVTIPKVEAVREDVFPQKGTGKLMKPEKTATAPTIRDRPRRASPLAKQSSSKPISKLPNPLPGRKTSHKPDEQLKESLQPATPLSRRQDALLHTRKTLPIWPHADSIRSALRKNNILVLTGETGSGKSTQVPQFLASEPWCTKCIAITQPRRVAAISLARRVAEEMGSHFGRQSPAAKVGYCVRFDNATGPNTKIKFLTEGMLLQETLRDPTLQQYSAVVVDEVHERSVNVDLILGFLKNLVAGVEQGQKRKHPLKVVVMSATADVEALVRLFNNDSNSLDEKGSEAAETDDTDSEGSWSGISSDAESDHKDQSKKSKSQSKSNSKSKSKTSQVATCFVEGRQYPVKTTYLPEPTQDWVESALIRIFQINHREPLPGDILVFLTGQDTIESLEKLVNDYAEGQAKDVPKLLCLPLFAALPQHAQQLVFNPTPPRTRKVILATNIAETSVTVPGVRFVIDCGKSKIKQFRNRLGLETLLSKPISKSAAIQRQGRAGREAPGQCYRLYTEESYNDFDERTTPEILRCDLSHAILTMKARGVDEVVNFPFLDRPHREALEQALLQLLNLGCMSDTGSITELGLKVAKLPLTPALGRVLVEAARPERDCLSEAIDIISALSVEDVFLNLVTEERKEEAEAARRELYRREGDHMTLLVTVQRYAEEQSDRKAWCQRHFVSHRAMQNVMNIRKQLHSQSLSLLPPSSSSSSSSLTAHQPPSTLTETKAASLLRCLLRGFIANTARLMPDGSYKTLTGSQTVAIHPSSVLFGRKTEGIVFTEFVYTGKAWARGVSACQLDWMGEVVGELMGS
ncbi:P-loop containing nucleoside triphosphate hydrolase protein [Lophiostoma macrostomum CBS 122681]|uniref:RNA helicase n=1 Tax=Lophiostoma macrostomum CBS 122681 TaxID=1314788 RepID=A0A6A6SMB0_9PLEO|nr:P-loop containing nucleoside triphosphate hydrolase protein [Lophiostoma macrostomum CBS 122681]